MSPKKPSRARRVLGVLGSVVGCTVLFTGATVAGVLLHLDLPVGHRAIRAQVGGILASTFQGTIDIERLDHVGLDGIAGARVTIRDPGGKEVLKVDGVDAEIGVLRTVKSVLFGSGDMNIAIDKVRVRTVDANLDTDPAGNLLLLNAFNPKNPSPPPPPNAPPGRGLKLTIPSIDLSHAWVHGTMQGAPPIDADLDQLDAAMGLETTTSSTTFDLHSVKLTTRQAPRGANPHGNVAGHFAMPGKGGLSRELTASFVGDVGGIPVTVAGTMAGDQVNAAVDVKETTAERVRALAPEAPVYETATAHLEASGTLPELDAKGKITVGAGSVDLGGHISLGDDKVISAVARARTIDVRAFAPTAPKSILGADLAASATLKKAGPIEGTFAFEVLPGRIDGQTVPHAKFDGTFVMADAGPSAKVRGHIDEAGAPIDLTADYLPDPAAPEKGMADFDVKVRVPSLKGIKRVGPIAAGSARVEATGRFHLATNALDADVFAAAEHLALSGNTVEVATVKAHASGPVASLVVDAHVKGQGLAAGSMRFASLLVDASGPVMSPNVAVHARTEDGSAPDLDVSGHLGLGGPKTTIDHAIVVAARGGVSARATVEKVTLLGGAVTVDGGRVEGLGAPLVFSAEKHPKGIRIKATDPDLDLSTVAKLAGIQDELRGGHLAIDTNLGVRSDAAKGDVVLNLTGLETKEIKGGTAHIDAHFLHRALQANVVAALGDAGRFELHTTTVELAAGALVPKAWIHAKGRATIAANIDLEKAKALLPKGTLPLDELSGKLVLTGDVGRDTEDEAPEFDIDVATRGLVASGNGAPQPPVGTVKVVSPPPWHVDGVDIGISAHTDGTGGSAELAARISDKHGAIATFDAKADLPYGQLFTDTSAAIAKLADTPIAAKLVVAKRDLGTLPAAFGTKGSSGTVELTFDVEGTPATPTVRLDAHTRGLQLARSPLGVKTDADVHFDYDAEDAHFLTLIRAPVKGKAQEVMRAKADLTLAAADLWKEAMGEGSAFAASSRADHEAHLQKDRTRRQVLRQTLGPAEARPALAKTAPEDASAGLAEKPDLGGMDSLPWNASASVKLSSFPLHAITQLADQQVNGRVSGDLEIKDLHKDAQVKGTFGIEGLKVARAKYTNGIVTVGLSGKEGLTARVRVDQTDGFVEANVKAPMTWGKELAPSLDASKPIDASLEAKSFRAAALFPFVSGSFSELDGRIDANAKAHILGAKATLQGKVALTKGVFQMPAIGEEFRNTKATVTFSEDGRIKVEGVEAEALSGKLTAKAEAKVKGTTFESASAEVHIPKEHPLPLALQGQELGDAYGDVFVKAGSDAKTGAMTINVDIPTFHAKLPDAASHSVQELDPAKEVRIGTQREKGTLVILPLAPPEEKSAAAAKSTPLHLAIKLGNDIQVKKGDDINVRLDGNPRVDVTDKSRVSGKIRLTQGTIYVQGRKFSIEKGLVAFTGEEASNPEVNVTASYKAPENVIIYADFVGPVKTGKVTLRSEPSLSQGEILSLLVFGTIDGMSSQAPGGSVDTASRAVGMGGGYATQAINKFIGSKSGVPISTRVDTVEGANPAPEVMVEVSREVALQIEYVLGQPPIWDPDRARFGVDWNVKTNYSIETTIGDHGTATVDGFWTYRY